MICSTCYKKVKSYAYEYTCKKCADENDKFYEEYYEEYLEDLHKENFNNLMVELINYHKINLIKNFTDKNCLNIISNFLY